MPMMRQNSSRDGVGCNMLFCFSASLVVSYFFRLNSPVMLRCLLRSLPLALVIVFAPLQFSVSLVEVVFLLPADHSDRFVDTAYRRMERERTLQRVANQQEPDATRRQQRTQANQRQRIKCERELLQGPQAYLDGRWRTTDRMLLMMMLVLPPTLLLLLPAVALLQPAAAAAAAAAALLSVSLV